MKNKQEKETISANLPKILVEDLRKAVDSARPKATITSFVEHALEKYIYGDDVLISLENAKQDLRN